MKISKILVGIDFSNRSEDALAEAMNIARHTGAAITLVHATTMPGAPDLPERFAGAEQNAAAPLEELFDHEHAQLAAMRARHEGQGVELSQLLVADLPDHALPAVAEQTGAELVVIGTRGLTGLKRILLGSVAERVVRLADTNVLVARPQVFGAGGFKKILVPTDFSQIAHKALHMALTIAAPGAEIELFHSWTLPATASGRGIPGAETIGQSLRSQIVDQARAAAEDLIARHDRSGVTFSFHNAEHTATKGVQTRLEDGGFEICVIGSHGRRGLRRFLLGSVAETTVRYAPCSVLVVHGKYAEDD